MVSSTVQPRLLAILTEQLYYDEIAIPFTRMQNECKQLTALLSDAQVDLQDRLSCSVFTIDQASELVTRPTLYFNARTPPRGPNQYLTCSRWVFEQPQFGEINSDSF